MQSQRTSPSWPQPPHLNCQSSECLQVISGNVAIVASDRHVSIQKLSDTHMVSETCIVPETGAIVSETVFDHCGQKPHYSHIKHFVCYSWCRRDSTISICHVTVFPARERSVRRSRGADKGGILVRDGESTSSQQLSERLSPSGCRAFCQWRPHEFTTKEQKTSNNKMSHIQY